MSFPAQSPAAQSPASHSENNAKYSTTQLPLPLLSWPPCVLCSIHMASLLSLNPRGKFMMINLRVFTNLFYLKFSSLTFTWFTSSSSGLCLNVIYLGNTPFLTILLKPATNSSHYQTRSLLFIFPALFPPQFFPLLLPWIYLSVYLSSLKGNW